MANFIKVTDISNNELVLNVQYIMQLYPVDTVQNASSVLQTTIENIYTKETVDELLALIEA